MTHVNILMVRRIVSETQTDRQLKFIIDKYINIYISIYIYILCVYIYMHLNSNIILHQHISSKKLQHW